MPGRSMSARVNVARVVGVVTILVAAASVRCHTAEDRDHRQTLESLVSRHATRTELEQDLGKQDVVYAKGEPSWADLEGFLAREPESNLKPLRKAMQKYSRIIYYTTAWRMTWVFLDENDRVQGFYIAAQ